MIDGTLKRGEWALLGFLFIFSFVPVFGGLLRVIEIIGGPQIIPENPRVLEAPIPAALHVISSFVFCVFGALQFLPSIRKHYPRFHRTNGLLVATSGILVATTGLWMTHFYSFPDELQGNLLYWFRVIASVSMAGFILLGIVSIRKRNLTGHYAWMISAYAIGLGASTQTVLGLAWMMSLGNEPLGFERDLMMASAWIINIAVAQWIISS